MKTWTLATLALVLLSFRSPMQAHWVKTNGPYGSEIRALTSTGTNLFTGTYGGGVFLSANDGTSWTPVNTGLSIAKEVYSLDINTNGEIFAVSLDFP